MEKKSKKRRQVLNERLQKLQKLLADTRKQCDSPEELQQLEQEIAKLRSELATLTDD